MVGSVEVVAARSLESLAVIPTLKYQIKEQDRIDEQSGQALLLDIERTLLPRARLSAKDPSLS